MNSFSSRWNKASNELNSHVVSSKARKAAAPRSSAAPPPPPAATGSLFSRLSTRMFGARSDESAATDSAKPSVESKRAFGFATKNLALYSDKNSEDLYRFKNLSSSYMRSSSPTNDDDEPSASGTTKPKEKNDSDRSDDEDDRKNSPRRQRRAKK